ncbi:Crp/Fnr family transcriptional regulator [Sphingomonas sp. LaA6.9]|uniref:Crp/Fnr family transcriptional regulator n=1 Tax=Sphingomonas sp. LaA6.9 TaxID=2919914 RepID=UPI001F5037BE|nr:Crp/Fnr family transcriptional regulator [Sphingomonas sp. LaA6.9]MCJ8157539.1 Crp/Fnr family transcriptional regulator [Sphingomonas sp. LaA6.9]
MTRVTALFLQRRRRERLSEEEKRALEDAVAEIRVLPARHVLVHQGDTVTRSTMLIEGLMCRYMDGRDGHRQLVALHVPGDFVDLHGFPLEQLDHDVATISRSKVATFPRETLLTLTRNHPHLVRMLWFSTLLDAAMHREWIFRLGRLGAMGRVAHFFCEMKVRLSLVGLSNDNRFHLAVTQADIAEACGLTPVHVNRVLRQLRDNGQLAFQRGMAHVLDWHALKVTGEFDDAYLYVDGTPD